MPTDVIMPQMGESIFEGTITKWLKKPGEKIQRDEPLFEISTDKVDAEIPAPTSGVLKEIMVPEGTTVQVNTVVGVIDEGGGAAAAPAKPAEGAEKPKPAPAVAGKEPETKAKAEPVAAHPEPARKTPEAGEGSEGEERMRSSPLVRRLAKEKNIDLRQVSGTGL